MPLFYTYKGFKFYIHSNDHNPPHVHVNKAEHEIRVKYNDLYGAIIIEFEKIRGKFSPAEKSDIEDFVPAP